jgi:hypothetical protein
MAADIALLPTYLGTEPGERIAFVGVSGNTSGGGVSRITDAYAKHFSTWSAGVEGRIGSVAYHADGKLLAGDWDENQVYVSLSPMETSPKFERVNTYKQPGGVNRTIVGWAGDNAIAGTSGDESAFGLSTDDGYAFNDISMIDTALGRYSDVAVNADGSKIYLAATDNNEGTTCFDVSIWLMASSWKRILSARDTPDANVNFLVRIAPEDDSVVYASYGASTNMVMSKNSGLETWKNIPAYKLAAVQDFAVESADVVYAMDTAGVSKTTNAGASWGTKKTWVTVSGNMMSLAPNGDILVGGDSGYIAFSKDGGSTFEVTTRVVTPSATVNGTVQVIADRDYADNNIIFAAADDDVYRGKAQKETQTWLDRGDLTSTGHDLDACGIATHDGVVYVAAHSTNTTESALFRALNLTEGDNAALCLWSSKGVSSSTTNYEFTAFPQVLKISPTADKAPRLWALAASANVPPTLLMSMNDPIATSAPPVKSPDDGFEVPVNPVNGKANNVVFTWERAYPHKSITGMQLQIATDKEFEDAVYDGTFTGIDSDTVTRVIGPNGATGQIVEYNPGETYYWRVRVSETGPMLSPWSETMSFSIAGLEVAFDLVAPARGDTDVDILPTFTWNPFKGAIGYEIMVAEDPTFAIIDWSRSVSGGELTFYKAEEALAYDTTYYWRVRGVTGPAAPKQAAPGGPWAVGMFTTMEKPAPPPEAPEPTVIVQKEPAPPAQVIEVPTPTPPPAIPATLLYIIIAIGGVLIIALIVLIVRTRRVV